MRICLPPKNAFIRKNFVEETTASVGVLGKPSHILAAAHWMSTSLNACGIGNVNVGYGVEASSASDDHAAEAGCFSLQTEGSAPLKGDISVTCTGKSQTSPVRKADCALQVNRSVPLQTKGWKAGHNSV